MAKNENVLEVKNLNAAYGEAKVIFDVSLNVKEKELVAIVGRNGAGKTTLLKNIVGLLKPVSGSIVFNGEEIKGIPTYQIAQKGLKYIDQDKKVFSELSVRENLELSSYAMNDYNLEKVMEYFPKLETLMDRQGVFLSGGEKQMLMIGRAILGKPQLLLIDEPTEGLAPSIVDDLVKTFKELKNETAIVIVGQNLSFVSRVADRVYAFKEGKIVTEVTGKEDIETANFDKYL